MKPYSHGPHVRALLDETEESPAEARSRRRGGAASRLLHCAEEDFNRDYYEARLAVYPASFSADPVEVFRLVRDAFERRDEVKRAAAVVYEETENIHMRFKADTTVKRVVRRAMELARYVANTAATGP